VISFPRKLRSLFPPWSWVACQSPPCIGLGPGAPSSASESQAASHLHGPGPLGLRAKPQVGSFLSPPSAHPPGPAPPPQRPLAPAPAEPRQVGGGAPTLPSARARPVCTSSSSDGNRSRASGQGRVRKAVTAMARRAQWAQTAGRGRWEAQVALRAPGRYRLCCLRAPRLPVPPRAPLGAEPGWRGARPAPPHPPPGCCAALPSSPRRDFRVLF
jgi:hypothetical protein